MVNVKKLFVFVALGLLLFSTVAMTLLQTPTNSNIADGGNFTGTIKVASWNLQIFGDSKASNATKMAVYANTIENFDIIFIQEIRDADGSAFDSLCSMLSDYSCVVSSRAGRSDSKEQYGIVFRKGLLFESRDYNPDALDRWERPPIEVALNIDNNLYGFYNIHVKPDDVEKELTNLEQLITFQGSTIVLGDLNADCSYYKNEGQNFKGWTWIINDEKDTTSSNSDCAYDRIITNPKATDKVVSAGIFKDGITPDISDHYPIWVELKI